MLSSSYLPLPSLPAIVMIKKKDGSWSFCVDFRKVNSMTQKDAYPLPRIDETLEALTGSQFFTTLDLVMTKDYCFP